MTINKVNTHIVPIEFEYHAPGSLDEAVSILDTHGEEAQILAGGTDLIPHMKQRKAEPKHIVNIKKIPELACIYETPEGIKIGALAKLRAIELSALIREKAPLLSEAARSIGSVQIRNLGTSATPAPAPTWRQHSWPWTLRCTYTVRTGLRHTLWPSSSRGGAT